MTLIGNFGIKKCGYWELEIEKLILYDYIDLCGIFIKPLTHRHRLNKNRSMTAYHTMNVIINFEIETHSFAQFIRWSICTSEKTCPVSIPFCFQKNNMYFCYHAWHSLLPVVFFCSSFLFFSAWKTVSLFLFS